MQIDGLSHPQPVAGHDEDQGCVPLTIAALASRLDELAEFTIGEIFHCCIPALPRLRCMLSHGLPPVTFHNSPFGRVTGGLAIAEHCSTLAPLTFSNVG